MYIFILVSLEIYICFKFLRYKNLLVISIVVLLIIKFYKDYFFNVVFEYEFFV